MIEIQITKDNIAMWQRKCVSLPLEVGSKVLVGHEVYRMATGDGYKTPIFCKTVPKNRR